MAIDRIQPGTVPPATTPVAAPAAPAAPQEQLPVVASDSLALTPRPLAVGGLKAGQVLKVDGRYKGHGFGGKSEVLAADPNQLDLMVNASALMGLVKVKVHLKFQTQADGTVMFLAERLDGGKKDKDLDAPDKVGKPLKVVSVKPGQTVFDSGHGLVKMESNGKGSVSISYDQYRITVKP